MTELAKYLEDIKRLCSRHKVKRLYAFGSVLTENYNESSDINFIVDFEPIDIAHYADNYYDFKFFLEDVFHKPIDLLEGKAIKTHIFGTLLTNSDNLFMDIEIKTWLYDIVNAVNEIESFFIEVPKDFNAYQNDVKTKRAVERNIEIIGGSLHLKI